MTTTNPRQVRTVTTAAPRFLPPVLRQALNSVADKQARAVLRFALFEAERKIWRKKKPISCSAWAARHRVVKGGRFPGRWRNEVTPYLVGIMDASFHRSVREIAICKGPQSGGSEAILNCLGYIISRAPGPVLLTYPDELTARDNLRERVLPMIEASPHLKGFLTGKADDATSLRINLLSMVIHVAWSGSAARLANKAIRYVIREEIDKWKNVAAEASSMNLADARTTTFEGKQKIFDVCTPTVTSEAIWQEMAKCDAIYDFWVHCPHCGHEQLMSFEGIRWGDETEPSRLLSSNAAFYACSGPDCGAMWPDADRDRAVRLGRWRNRDSGEFLADDLKANNPRKIGFHLFPGISRFVPLAKIAAAWLQWKKSGNLDDFKEFKNRYCALPWVEIKTERTVDAILAHCDDRPRGIVPGPEILKDGSRRARVAALLAGVDTQGTYLRFAIRAFGYGASGGSWLVAAGSLGGFDALEKLLFGSVFYDGPEDDPLRQPYTVAGTVQDAMGHRTYEVYEFCAKYKGLVFPYKGEGRGTAPIRYSPREYYPGTSIKIPGGINLLRSDTHYFKSQLAAALSVSPQDPGAFLLHSNHGPDSDAPLLEEYAKEMTAEYFDQEKLLWKCQEGMPNHYWDCEVMCQVAAYELGVRFWPHPDDTPPPPPPRKKRPQKRSSRW